MFPRSQLLLLRPPSFLFFYVLKNQVQVRDAVMGHFSCAMSYINFLRNWLCLNNFFRSLFITILFQFTGKYLSFLTLHGLDPFHLGWFGDQINIMISIFVIGGPHWSRKMNHCRNIGDWPFLTFNASSEGLDLIYCHFHTTLALLIHC